MGEEHDPLSALNNARIVIWFCKKDSKHRVEWTDEPDGKMTPRCIEEGCGEVGASR